MAIIKPLFIILLMSLSSKFLRQTAFGRSDSIALDVSICSFLYNLMIVAGAWSGLMWFVREESLRCLLLFLFAFITAFVHKQNKKKCVRKAGRIVTEIRTAGGYSDISGAGNETKPDRIMEATVLDNLELLAQSSIDVWYSQFADAMFGKQLKAFYDRRNSGGQSTEKNKTRSFKEKKRRIRSAFAAIVNSLPTMNGKMMRTKYSDEDFNIGNEDQIMGMLIFDVMMALSLIVAVRLI